MFKKFNPATDVASQTLLKSSVQRQIRANLTQQYPFLAANNGQVLEAIWPKKESLVLHKCRDFTSIYSLHGVVLFFQHDDRLYPSLRVLHRYPGLLPKVQVDRGAIRYLLAGAHMMCPGLTSPGGWLPPPEEKLEGNTTVAIFAQGKEHPLAVGVSKLSTEEMKTVNKGVAVELITYLGDDLWAHERL